MKKKKVIKKILLFVLEFIVVMFEALIFACMVA
jgi:hypothetical protein